MYRLAIENDTTLRREIRRMVIPIRSEAAATNTLSTTTHDEENVVETTRTRLNRSKRWPRECL